MGKTKFQSYWLKEFSWIESLKGDSGKVWCKLCKKSFKIDGSGKSQVLSHQKSHSIQDGGENSKKTSVIDPKQRVFQLSFDGSVSMGEKVGMPFNLTEQICKAELYQALHVAEYNHSFSSTKDDSKRFKLMFPNDAIAQGYNQGETKVKYNLQFGIAPYCKEKLIYDVRRRPFSFKFD